MKQFTEQEHVDIAWQQYRISDTPNAKIWIGNDNKYLGELKSFHDSQTTGLKAYVIQNDVGDITLLFKGSEMPGKEGWKPDWLLNNIPIVS